MPNSEFDSERYRTRQWLPLFMTAGIPVPGTVAAATDLIRLPINQDITIDTIRMVAQTGSTAAGGPILGFGKSLAGTGAVVVFASQIFTTNANNTVLTPFNTSFSTVYSTAAWTFTSGDVLVIQNLAGTNAATPQVNISIGYREFFTNANP